MNDITAIPGCSEKPVVLIATKADLAQEERIVTMNRGEQYKAQLGRRCTHFQEVTTFTDDLAKTNSKLIDQVVSAAIQGYRLREKRAT